MAFYLFGHLSKISVNVGQTLSKNMQIGIMGSTGHSTGAHVHFEKRAIATITKDVSKPETTAIFNSNAIVTQDFWEYNPSLGYKFWGGYHPGIDLVPANSDWTVKTPFNAKVIFVGDRGDGYGNCVVIERMDSTTSIDGRVQQIGKCTVVVDVLNVRSAPTTSSQIVATYSKGEIFTYDSYIDNEGIRWVSYIGKSGNRRYVARRKLDNSIIYTDVS